MAIKLQDFLNPVLLGNTMIAIKGYEEVIDRETQKLSAYRLNVSLQDSSSDFFMELITVKVNNLNPTISVDELLKNKATPVQLQDLKVGEYKGTLWYSCTDVKPATK